MGRLFAAWYALALVALWAVYTILRAGDGAVLLLSFEGDAVHLADIALRMQAGQIPGRDFLTPLGALAFLPIVWLMQTGFGIGMAVAYAPAVLGLALLPALWWLGLTRLPRWGALGLGFAVLTLLMSYLHGGLSPTVTLSMYYNNWCWAVSFLVVLAAVTPGARDRLAVALVVGLGMGLLALVKATFAVYLAPGVVLALALRRRWGELAGAVALGLVLVAVVSWPLGGLGYLRGYAADLMAVAGSPVRAAPGKGLVEMAISPGHVLALGLWLMAALFFRQAGRNGHAAVVLVLGAGFFAITHQNWQNDPHWLALFGLLMLAEARGVALWNGWGWPIGRALQVLGVAALAVSGPPLYAQVQSLLIHGGLDRARFVALVPGDDDLRVKDPAGEVAVAKVAYPAGLGLAPEPETFQGERLPWCEKETGLVADLQATGRALGEMVPAAGRTALYADWVNALWLFSPLAPLPGASPWYYGGTAGAERAYYLVVPLCPMGRPIRAMVLKEIETAGLVFREVARNELMIVYERVR